LGGNGGVQGATSRPAVGAGSDRGGGSKALIDYFAVAGLDPTHGLEPELFSEDTGLDLPPVRRPFRAYIANHYPEERNWNKPFDAAGVLMLCFPQGLQLRWKSESRYIRCHSFVMTKECGAQIYGVTLIYYEKVVDQQILQAMGMLEAMYQQQQALTKSSSSSSSNIVQPGGADGRGGDTTDRTASAEPEDLYAQKAITVLSQFPAVACFEEYLRQLYTVMHSGPELPLEVYVSNLLFEVPAPRPGRAVRFNCGGPLRVAMPFPEDPPMCEFSFRRLFSLFSIDIVLAIYGTILLEEQVVLRSNDLSLLTLVAECFTELLYPFAWPYVYVPILPATQLLFLEAPMPFVMGLPGVHEIGLPQTIVSINIDAGVISNPEAIPPLPRLDWLRETLANIMLEQDQIAEPTPTVELRELAKGLQLPPIAMNPCTDEAATYNAAIRQAFLAAFVDTFVDLDTYLIQPTPLPAPPSIDDTYMPAHDPAAAEIVQTDAEFDKVAFLSDQPDHAQFFLSQFLETQMFTTFIDTVGPVPLDMVVDPDEAKRRAVAREDLQPFMLLVNERRKQDRGGDKSLRDMVTMTTAKISARGRECTSPNDFVANQPALPVAVAEEPDAPATPGSTDNHLRPPLPEFFSLGVPITPTSSYPRPAATTSTPVPPGVSVSPDRGQLLPRAELFGFHNPEIIHAAHLQWSRQTTFMKWLESPERAERPRSRSFASRRSTPTPVDGNASEIDASFSDILLTNFAASRGGGGPGPLSRLGTSHDHFVAALLADCATKVKKCVVTGLSWAESRGAEQGGAAFGAGSSSAGVGAASLGARGKKDGHGGLNAVVINLCQVLERTFRHGLRSTDRNQEKSALWIFLEAAVSRTAHRGVEGFRDVRLTRGMTFLRTDTGKAHAWVRLCLEKKTLHSSLELLLQDTSLVKKNYKEYGCIAHDECRTFILQHLETLRVVDFGGLFTANVAYRKALVGYHVEIVTAKGFRYGTTANVQLGLTGSLAVMKPIVRENRPGFNSGCVDSFVFEVPNLGCITRMTVSNDGIGSSPSWHVASIKITNLLTGIITEFADGYKLGKSESLTLCPLEDGGSDGGLLGGGGSGASECAGATRTLKRRLSPKDKMGSDGTVVPDEIDQRHGAVCASVARAVNGIVRFDTMCGSRSPEQGTVNGFCARGCHRTKHRLA
jgi:hypothetical protein